MWCIFCLKHVTHLILNLSEKRWLASLVNMMLLEEEIMVELFCKFQSWTWLKNVGCIWVFYLHLMKITTNSINLMVKKNLHQWRVLWLMYSPQVTSIHRRVKPQSIKLAFCRSKSKSGWPRIGIMCLVCSDMSNHGLFQQASTIKIQYWSNTKWTSLSFHQNITSWKI